MENINCRKFTEYNGTAVNGFARLNPDGTLDTSFNKGSGANLSLVLPFNPTENLNWGSFTEYNAQQLMNCPFKLMENLNWGNFTKYHLDCRIILILFAFTLNKVY